MTIDMAVPLTAVVLITIMVDHMNHIIMLAIPIQVTGLNWLT
jgi:hypothetical protein